MPQHIKVVNYDDFWPILYEKEKNLIIPILEDDLVSIHHIGSTSVKGMKAKPIIDILIVVKSLEIVDNKKDDFIKIGYEYLGEFGIKNRRYLRKGGDERTHQIHIFKEDNELDILRHLILRDYLRVNENARKEYSALKEDLAKKYPYDIEGYCDEKDPFMKKLEKESSEWYKNSRK